MSHEVWSFGEHGNTYTTVETEHGDKIRIVSYEGSGALSFDCYDTTGHGVTLAFPLEAARDIMAALKAHLKGK